MLLKMFLYLIYLSNNYNYGFGHTAQTACVNNNQQVHIKGLSSDSECDINYLFNNSIAPI